MDESCLFQRNVSTSLGVLSSLDRFICHAIMRASTTRRHMKTVDIIEELRTHIARKYTTQKAAAEAWGVTAQFVTNVLKGRSAPTDAMLKDAGYEFAKVYVRKKREPT
jgi:hypothetical protein